MNPARLLRAAALLSWLALVLTLLFWYRDKPWLAVALALPLAFPLPGLWRGRRYTYAWCSLLVLFYLGFGIVEAVATPATRAVAYVELAAAATLFVCALLYVRSARTQT